MNDRTHAEHSGPERTPSSFGSVYPQDDIVAVIADGAEAGRAVEDLRAAGIPSGDIVLATGDQVLEFEHDFERRQGPLDRLARAVSFLFSEEASYEQEFVDAARAGAHLLVVHAPRDEVVELVRPILAAHGAHPTRHYKRWVVEDLA
jgi:hypothetical protein